MGVSRMLNLLFGVLVVLLVALTVRAVADCVRTPRERVQYVPKVLWLLFMLHAPVLGAIVWVNFGKGPVPDGGTAKAGQAEPMSAAAA